MSKRQTNRIEKAIIYKCDGVTVDIRKGGSSCIIRNVHVEGDISTIRTGQLVTIGWTNGRPVVINNTG